MNNSYWINCIYVCPHTTYKYVYLYYNTVTKITVYKAQYKNTNKKCDTDREAAICVDKWLIKQGKEPINILKKKQ